MISYIVVGVPLDHRYIVVKGLTTVQDNITILWIDLKTYVKQNEKEPQANIRTQNYQFFEFSTQKIEVKLFNCCSSVIKMSANTLFRFSLKQIKKIDNLVLGCPL